MAGVEWYAIGINAVAVRGGTWLEGVELREFKTSLTSSKLVSQNARHLFLWTERGAARHAKMLDTEQAWDVFTHRIRGHHSGRDFVDTKYHVIR